MDLDEAELLCYLAAHANGEERDLSPLLCDQMGRGLFERVRKILFVNGPFGWGGTIEDVAGLHVVTHEIVRVARGLKDRLEAIEQVGSMLYPLAERMREELIPTRSAKVLIMQTALLKRLGKLKEDAS